VHKRPNPAEKLNKGVETEFDSKKILVAEDVETNQKIAEEMISMLGYRVEIASNGKEALDKLSKDNFDLVFMDCQMPVMDGYEATRKIRILEEQNPSRRIPIIALTAGFNPEDRVKCTNAGMDYYLTKPFSVSDIRDVLEKFLGEKSRTDEENSERNAQISVLEHHKSNDGGLDIFNTSAIENIREVEKQTGKSLLPSIYQGFIEQMDEKLTEMSTHIKSGDTISVYRTAHAIKSMSANIGAEKVRYISSQIEIAGKNEQIDDLGEFVEDLDDGYSEFRQAFEEAFIS
jgi:CheY-like chemotaxis protein/HPt (histidine-containing phosphotransfer) domain-containing protein